MLEVDFLLARLVKACIAAVSQERLLEGTGVCSAQSLLAACTPTDMAGEDLAVQPQL